MARPAEYYVHSNPMDERLHAHPDALQVSARMRNLATLVMEREEDRVVEADSSLKLESSRPKATTRRLRKGGNGINVRAVLMDTETSQRKRDGEMVYG